MTNRSRDRVDFWRDTGFILFIFDKNARMLRSVDDVNDPGNKYFIPVPWIFTFSPQQPFSDRITRLRKTCKYTAPIVLISVK